MEPQPPPAEVPAHNHIGKLNPLEQSIVDYTGYTAPNPEPPRTFVLECNKQLAQQDGNALQTNEWTNVFPSIKLKKGDIISVNSSFLSARGGGDLIQFDSNNNTTRIIFEYYQTNDNTNGKRPSYNIKGMTPPPSDWNQYGGYFGDHPCSMNCLPVDYRPMRVYRLMKTFSSIDPTTLATPLGTDFSLYPFSDATTQFPSSVREPFWGYKVSPKAIQDNIEDTYVPGLLRHPTLNYTSPNYVTEVGTNGNISQRFPYATPWYVTTQKSHLGACSAGATMRIYFLGSTETANYTYQGLNVPMATILADNLNLVKSLRVGQYIKFMNPNCFGEDAYNPWNNEQSYTTNYGSNVYICDSYVADGGGFSPNADRFIQAGSGPHAKNPMGNLMKITKTYIGATTLYPQGNNNVGQTFMSDIDICPYVEVACSEGFSCCWGNPNAYVSAAGGGRASFTPFQNGPMTISATLNTNDAPPLPLSICPFGQVQLRVMEMKNNAVWNTTTSADGSNAVSAGFFPETLNVNKKLYLGYHPKYLDKTNTGGTGFEFNNITGEQIQTREDLLSTYVNNKVTFLDSVGSSVACRQLVVPTNYNMLGLNSDLSYTQSDPTKPLYYGDQYASIAGGYAGGRLPSGYMPDNNQIGYSDGSNYMTATKEVSSAFASMYEYNQTQLDNDTTSLLDETARATLVNTKNSLRVPKRNGVATAVDTLFLTSQNGHTFKCYISCSINDTATGIGTSALGASPAHNAPVAGSGANFESGMDNFINNFGSFPDSPSNDAPQNGGRMYYGNLPPPLPAGSLVSPVYDNIGDRFFVINLDRIDFRIPFAQMEQNLIIKATNPTTGDTEWMLGKTYPYSVKTNSVSSNPGFFNNTQPLGTATEYGIRSSAYNAGVPQERYQNVRFVIVKRDILGTGRKNFTGAFATSNSNNFSGDILKPTADTAYFEIFNSLAHFEHRIKLDGISRDLTALNALDKTNNTLYNELWASASTTGAIGGDFVLCDDPKMPYVDNTSSITRMTDNTTWLIDDFIKQGDPTETDSGEIDPNGNPVMLGHTNGLTWNIHYDFIDLNLDSEATYFGVGDIGAEITKQLQKPTDLYKTNNSGGSANTDLYWENSAGRFPTNKMFRPIHGPMSSSNTEDPTTGMLNGAYHEGDFCFFSAISDAFFKSYKVINPSGGNYEGTAVSAGTGLFPVFPRSQNTHINVAPTSDAFSLKNWCLAHKSPAPRTLFSNHQFGDTIKSADLYSYDNTSFTQFIGATAPTFSYNENFNRFEWSYFHQPLYTPYDAVSQTGGNPSAYIWSNVSEGLAIYDRFGGVNVVNWCSPKYEFGQYASRNTKGFVDILKAEDVVGGKFMDKLGFNSAWRAINSGHTHYVEDVESSIKLSAYKPLGTTQSDYSVAQGTLYTAPSLWNAKSVGSKGQPYVPLPSAPVGSAEDKANQQRNNDAWGTQDFTDSTFFSNKSDWFGKVGDVLISSSITGPIGAGAINANVPIADPIPVTTPTKGMIYGMGNTITYTGISFPSQFTGCNGFQFGMDVGDKVRVTDILGNPPDITKLAPSNALIAYGWGSTQGTPGSFGQGPATIGATPGFAYSNTNTFKYVNLDDIKLPYTAYDVESSSLRAPQLPKKTEVGYFFIMSDLIDKHEFYGSKNDGAPINCIGILSKNYENHDFYYSFQSPVEFYLKADKTITSITTRILTPDMKMPIGLDYNSSIIYTIVRPDPVPDADVPPISLQQQYDYEEMEKLQEQAGVGAGGRMIGGSQHVATGVGTGLSGGGGNNLLNYYRNAIVQAVISPQSNQASALSQLEMGISNTLSGMSAPNRLRANADGFNVNPMAVQPTDPDPEADVHSPPVFETPPIEEYEVGILGRVNKILEALGPEAEPELVGDALQTAGKKNPMDDDDKPPPTPPPAYDFSDPDYATLPPGYEPIVEALAERIQFYADKGEEGDPAGGKPEGADPDAQGLSFEEAFKALDPSLQHTRGITALQRAGFDPSNPRSYPSRILGDTLEKLKPLLEQRGTPLSGELISGLEEERGRRQMGATSPKEGELPYYLSGGFGGTSLREAITRTIAPEFGYGDPKYDPKRTDSDQHTDWFHTDRKQPDHPTLKSNKPKATHEQAVGDENPWDISTWSKGRLQGYSKDPLFHVKAVSKQGKELEKLSQYPQKERLSSAGMGLINDEIKRRTSTTSGGQKIIQEIRVKYGSGKQIGTKAVVGGKKRAKNDPEDYMNKKEAPKGYTGRTTAHRHGQHIDKPRAEEGQKQKSRPPPIQYTQQQQGSK